MIKPTNGRIVWYTPDRTGPDDMIAQHDKKVPLSAIVCHVWGDRCVNLLVISSNGDVHPRTSVDLLQGDEKGQERGRYCEWMPFQRDQAKAFVAAPLGRT